MDNHSVNTGSTQTSLFDAGDYVATNPTTRPKTPHRCRDCIFSMEHQYSKQYFYCKKQFDKKTAYGYKKIKRLDFTCSKFEPIHPDESETKSPEQIQNDIHNLPF